MHDPMNLIWLCHEHNLAFDRHEFGLSLGGLDNSVEFFSCLEKYTQLVADANTRHNMKKYVVFSCFPMTV